MFLCWSCHRFIAVLDDGDTVTDTFCIGDGVFLCMRGM